jgi:hypothetical protein
MEHITPSHYSVMVLGLPESLGLEGQEGTEKVRQFFQSKFGDVYECTFAHEFNNSLGLYNRMADIDKEIAKEEIRCQIMGKPDSVTLDKLRETRNDAKEALKLAIPDRADYDHLPLNRAFIIFNSIDSKVSCMRAYQQCRCCCCITCSCCLANELCYPKDGVPYYTLQVKNAPAPSDIIWENLEASCVSKFFRGLIAFICVLILLIFSYAAVYAIQTAQSSFPTSQDCSQYPSITLQQAAAATNTSYVTCYCQPLSQTQVNISCITSNNSFLPIRL